MAWPRLSQAATKAKQFATLRFIVGRRAQCGFVFADWSLISAWCRVPLLGCYCFGDDEPTTVGNTAPATSVDCTQTHVTTEAEIVFVRVAARAKREINDVFVMSQAVPRCGTTVWEHTRVAYRHCSQPTIARAAAGEGSDKQSLTTHPGVDFFASFDWLLLADCVCDRLLSQRASSGKFVGNYR